MAFTNKQLQQVVDVHRELWSTVPMSRLKFTGRPGERGEQTAPPLKFVIYVSPTDRAACCRLPFPVARRLVARAHPAEMPIVPLRCAGTAASSANAPHCLAVRTTGDRTIDDDGCELENDLLLIFGREELFL